MRVSRQSRISRLCEKRGGSSGGGGGGGATSERNALGQEVAYGGEEKNVGNSRLFGIHEEVQNLNNYRSYDAATQAGVIDSAFVQLRNRDDSSPLTQRASRDISTLWRNTSPEARDLLGRQGLGDSSARNSAAQRITRDVRQRMDRAEQSRQRARQQTRSNRNNDDDGDLGGLFG